MRRSNRFGEAIKEGYNVVGLAGVAALSAALLTPVPLIAGVIAEAVYLLFVPDSKWYEKRLSTRYNAEVEQKRADVKNRILPTLRAELQQRFARLEATRLSMESSPTQDETWFRDVLRKLDYLLEKFLLFAAKENEYRGHLQSVLFEVRGTPSGAQYYRSEKSDPRRREDRNAPPPSSQDRATEEIVAHYESEMAQVQRQMEQEADEDTKAILAKRLDVLKRRQEFVGKLSKILVNLTHQMELLEDTFGLINDEIRARSPEQVVSDIDDVVFQTDSMVQVLEELAPYEQLTARLEA